MLIRIRLLTRLDADADKAHTLVIERSSGPLGDRESVVNRNSKIWATTNTGMKSHAFPDKSGSALCRKNIKAREYDVSNNDFASLSHIREMFPASDVCTTCESRFLSHEAFLESEHVAALRANEEFDAKAAPVACCDHAPMYHGARGCDQCGCATPRNTDSKETNDVSIKTGPLTERQKRIITYLREGKRHEEIVSLLEEGSTVNVVKQECQNIRAKFRTNTVTQAVSLWATAQAYRETATLIGSHRPPHVDDETDVHVDHVLYGLMQILRERADRLTPR